MSLDAISDDDLASIHRLLDVILNHAHTHDIQTVSALKELDDGRYSALVTKACAVAYLDTASRHKRKRLLAKENKTNTTTAEEKQPSRKYCYICRESFAVIGAETVFCPNCKAVNLDKRFIRADLTHKLAIVTGGRVKIGFETAIRLLQCNATVIVTTRFPADCLSRYESHPDYPTFNHRLSIYAVDLRYMQDIDAFVQWVQSRTDRVDILIHNAAQTLRRPQEFFQHLLPAELALQQRLLLTNGSSAAANDGNKSSNNEEEVLVVLPQACHLDRVMSALSPAEDKDAQAFPINQLDSNQEQVDLRRENTWTSRFGQVNLGECAELLSINTLAPFHLTQALLPLLVHAASVVTDSSNVKGSYVVNVSSMEGCFNIHKKGFSHPQTNMAKAALNMFTRTTAPALAKEHEVYMVAVDTGWVTNEFPVGHISSRDGTTGGAPPLDCLDGACRVLDPVLAFYNGKKAVFGVFLKDYEVHPW